MSEITQKRLHKLFYCDESIGDLIRLERVGKEAVGTLAGCPDAYGYLRTMVDGFSYKNHRLVWLYFKGYCPEQGLDHRDRVKHHNWLSNLRERGQQCNMRNTGDFKSNTSGVKGVTWCRRDLKWIAQIHIKKKHKFLGRYKSFDNAVCARLAGEQCLDWSGCDSSSPAFRYVRKNLTIDRFFKENQDV